MSFLFSVYVNNHQNLTKFSSEVISESQKLATQATGKIKCGFISLLNSISNSFTSLKKIFSFSAGSEKINSVGKDSVFPRTAPPIIVDNTAMSSVDDLPSASSREGEFNKLKSEMHARLNVCFNHQRID